MVSTRRKQNIVSVYLLMLMCASFSGASYAQGTEDLSIIGPVVAVETPEFSWPMEFEAVKIFYVRVEKVLKGNIDDKYIRIGYGYNPSDSSQNNLLPVELFNGKTVWKFDVSKMSGFEHDTLPMVKTETERIAELKESDDIIAAPVIKESNSDDTKDFHKVLKVGPGYYACIIIPGFEAEKAGLASMNTIKSYWLEFPFNKGLKLVRSGK